MTSNPNRSRDLFVSVNLYRIYWFDGIRDEYITTAVAICPLAARQQAAKDTGIPETQLLAYLQE